MKVARFWAKETSEAIRSKNESIHVSCWRWSEKSIDDARTWAREAAQKAAKQIAAGKQLRREYEYLSRPPREEIIEEIKNRNGEVIATITRNGYGSLILNTKELMFIDIDIPYERPKSKIWVALCRLFGHTVIGREAHIESRLIHLVQNQLQYTTRLYRTCAGYRCVILNKPIDPTSQESADLFDLFQADPLYIRLCKNQKCYRARLTPKPWRLKFRTPPNRYPWGNEPQKQRYRRWEKEYAAESKSFATCQFLEQSGKKKVNLELQALIELHDKITRVGAALPLA